MTIILGRSGKGYRRLSFRTRYSEGGAAEPRIPLTAVDGALLLQQIVRRLRAVDNDNAARSKPATENVSSVLDALEGRTHL